MSILFETLINIKENIEREFSIKPTKEILSKHGSFYGLRYDGKCSEIYIIFNAQKTVLLEQRIHGIEKGKTFVDRILCKTIPLNELIPNFELLIALDEICVRVDKGLTDMPDTSEKLLAEFRKIYYGDKK